MHTDRNRRDSKIIINTGQWGRLVNGWAVVSLLCDCDLTAFWFAMVNFGLACMGPVSIDAVYSSFSARKVRAVFLLGFVWFLIAVRIY